MNKVIHISIACLLLITFKSQSLAQEKNLQKVFAPVKKEFRTKLINRLRLLTQYERTQQRDKSYDLLFGDEVEGRTREEFVKWKREVLGRYDNWFMEFIPESVDREVKSKYLQADYRIVGTVILKDEDNRIRISKGYVYAWRRNGDWYFSGFSYVLETFW